MTRRYSAYKDSGVEWIGEIPEHWECLAIRRSSKVKRGASPRPIDDPKYFDDAGVYSWVRISDLTASDRYLVETESKLSELGASLSVKLNEGELFLSIAGSVGKPIITRIKCCIHDGFVYFENLNLDAEFLYYIFISGTCFNGLGKFGTQLNLNTDTIGSIKIPKPTLNEQSQIVEFLDAKTSLIDRLVDVKQRRIELLKEKRAALINIAVTKGLDPNVKMKDSGIEWIGEIPEHWVVSKLGLYAVKIGAGSTPTGGSEVYSDAGIPFIRSQNVLFSGLSLDGVVFIDTAIRDSMSGSKVLFADVLLNITGGSIGRCCVVDTSIEMNVNQHVSIIRTDNRLDRYFLNYILQSELGQTQVRYNLTGGNREGLTIEGIRNFDITLPAKVEQLQIVSYLNSETKKIDDLVALEQKKIDLLKEYRQALISETVTGKIKIGKETGG